MYKNGDPKKKVAKTDATSVNIVRHDIPLPSSDNLFGFKEVVAESSGGLSGNVGKGAVAGAKMGMVKKITPLPKNYYTMKKTKTSIKRPKK